MGLFENLNKNLNESVQYDYLPELIENMEEGSVTLDDIIHDLPSEFDTLVDKYDKFNEIDNFMSDAGKSLSDETRFQVWDYIWYQVLGLAKNIVETSGKDVEEE